MQESDIEARLRKKVTKAGGLCWKWVSPGRRGVPDRIIIMPGGVTVYVELKAPGKTERPDQVLVQRMLRERGCWVVSSVDSFEKVDALVAELVKASREREVMNK